MPEIIYFALCTALGVVLGYFVGIYRQKAQSQVEKTELQIKVAQTEVELKSIQQQQQLMGSQFENLAQKIFEEKTTAFAAKTDQSLSSWVEPLKNQIKDFESKIQTIYNSENHDRGVLKGELSKLLELNQAMSQDAKNLTLALKGDNKSQGNWGELILESILERSGLRKDIEYFTQATFKGEEGQSLRPDIVIQLPDQKHLIVDSKMTLNAYEQYSQADSAEQKQSFAKLHVESLKRHIDGLSEKKYHLAEKVLSPDFVMLFMPLEPAFALAFQQRPEIFQYAWEKNIAIVSPTTLLTTLRTAAALWKQDRQEKNALEIAKRGGLLYDKFVGLYKDLQAVGDKLTQAQTAHQDVLKKIQDGRGNLIDQVEELKKLGAKAEKQITL